MCKKNVLDVCCWNGSPLAFRGVLFWGLFCQRAPYQSQQEWDPNGIHHHATAASVALEIFVTPRDQGLGTVEMVICWTLNFEVKKNMDKVSKHNSSDSQWWDFFDKLSKHITRLILYGMVVCYDLWVILLMCLCHSWVLLGMPSWTKPHKAKQPPNHGKNSLRYGF